MIKKPVDPFLDFYDTPDMIFNSTVFGVGGGGPFSPLTFSPALWLDASDSATLYDATTGGSLVAASGAVARWEDKSGFGRHATAATNRPTREIAAVGSKDALAWNTSKHMSIPSQDLVGGWGIAQFTVFCVVQTGSTGTYRALYSWTPDSVEYFLLWAGYLDNNYYLDGGNTSSGGRISGAGINTAAARQVTTRREASGAASVRQNGASVISGTLSDTLNSGTGTFEVGYNQDAATSVFNGFYCELLAIPSALNDTDRDAVESYLKAKWGTP